MQLSLNSPGMRDTIFLPFQLLSTIAKLIRPGGNKTLIAENLSLKQQLIINSRSRQRAQNLTTRDRNILGVLPLFLHPRRLARSAIIKPSTLLSFQNALKKRKYRLLFSSRGGRKPGPKGQSEELNNAIVGMKQRNVPMSHPFVELLICSIRRGLLDQTFFWLPLSHLPLPLFIPLPAPL